MNESALVIRANVIRTIRQFFYEQGFLEVETPLLIPANAPEEYIDPLPAANCMQMQTSPEICMKRLLCRGHSRIFQISRCWRMGERGIRHLPEFTMLEWYRDNADYLDLMDDCVALIRKIADSCTKNGYFNRNRIKIDPFAEWRNISLTEAFSGFAEADALISAKNGEFEEILSSKIEPMLETFPVPVILRDYPASMAALSKISRNDPRFAERFELYIGGIELANGFSELNDPGEQRMRFKEANRVRNAMGKDSLPLPEPFLGELSSMPTSAGIALGVDRLVMVVSEAESIDEIVAFTPEKL